MLRGKSTFLLVVLFSISFNFSAFASFEGIEIYDDLEIEEVDEYPGLKVFDTPPDFTTVSITGGWVYEIEMYNSSVLNMSGGSGSSIRGYDSSTVNFTGGYMGDVVASNNSVINISGGKIDDGLVGYDTSIINITGGDLGQALMRPLGQSTINIYGYGLSVNSITTSNWGFSGLVTGFWENGDPCYIRWTSQDETLSNVQLHEIPEPATLALFALGAVAVCRKRRV